jgi:hypothetical protein
VAFHARDVLACTVVASLSQSQAHQWNPCPILNRNKKGKQKPVSAGIFNFQLTTYFSFGDFFDAERISILEDILGNLTDCKSFDKTTLLQIANASQSRRRSSNGDGEGVRKDFPLTTHFTEPSVAEEVPSLSTGKGCPTHTRSLLFPTEL